MDKWRRYVCLAVNQFGYGTYPLRRIDASSLFYPTNPTNVTTMPPDEPPLPDPCISFSPSRPHIGKGSLDFFGFFGLGKKKTLLAAVDCNGVSHTYDVDDRVISEIASPQEPKGCEPVTVALGDALYVLDRKLVAGRLRCFQPPPFVFEHGYKTTSIDAYSSWDKAGDWKLPFHGRADFFSEHGAWLGFSAEDNRLCCSLNLGASTQRQPVLDMVWDDPSPQPVLDDPNQKSYTRVLKSQLVHLGSGKFCVAKFLERVENELTELGNIPQIERFAVLTGLALKPGEFGRRIDMIPHKSVLYKFEGISNRWVF
ncbi:unnamed protein product [Urochloa decumbens]|uniref:DUF1618 domain-containing protein n=1 Tax=Urochloa decumbens TaxID=240449 RepID=A0ABC8XKI2_9POAL